MDDQMQREKPTAAAIARLALERYGIVLAFLVLFFTSAVLSDKFLTVRNLLNVMRQVSFEGIIAVGMTFVILSAGIDLSVGALLCFAACVCAGLIMRDGLHPVLAIVLTLLIGTAIGAANGLIIVLGRVQPFIVTLGMMTVLHGASLLYVEGKRITLGIEPPPTIKALDGSLLGVPVPALVFVVVVAAAAFILSRTRFGREVYAIGGNEEAAYLAGVNVAQRKVLIYAISGLLSALSGVLVLARLRSANAELGVGYELTAIAAVVIGGTNLMGGEGWVLGTFVGSMILGVLANILNLRGVSEFIQEITKGAIIIGAVLLKRERPR